MNLGTHVTQKFENGFFFLCIRAARVLENLKKSKEKGRKGEKQMFT